MGIDHWRIGWRILRLILLVLAAVQFALPAYAAAKTPDCFTSEAIYIAPQQTIGRLLVTGADAAVAGRVTKGIVVIDGDIVIHSGAEIEGIVLVVGGRAAVEDGARLEEAVLAIAPRSFPMAAAVVMILLTIAVIGLAVFPAAIWLILRLTRQTSAGRQIGAFLRMLQRRQPSLYILGSLTISGWMLFLFMKIAWETLFKNTMGLFDNVFIWLVRYFANPKVDPIMVLLTQMGSVYFYGVLTALLLLFLTFYRRRLEGAVLMVCLIGGGCLNYLLKHVFDRARPDAFRVVEESGYSFPSGHAMVAFCFYGMLGFLIVRRLRSRPLRLLALLITLFLIAGIGVSRIYLGVHYPTDVAAGYIAGGAWLSFCLSLLLWREQKR